MSNENIIQRKERTIVLRDGVTYTLRPLTLNELIGIWPTIEKLQSAGDTLNVSLLEEVKKMMAVVLKGQLDTQKDVGDIIDIESLKEIIQVIVGQGE